MRRKLAGVSAALSLALLGGPVPSVAALDPVIDTLGERVDLDRMHADIADLVAFGSRRANEPGGLEAQNYVLARLQALGFNDLRLQDFDANTDNVIVTIPGVVDPDEIYVLGAHYDSINDDGPGLPAPGADDNGTGVAGLLEIARIIAQSELRFEATIQLVAFTSEELGRLGSKAFVDEAIADGRTPRYGLVMDVLGYLDDGSVLDLSIGTSEQIPGTTALVGTTTGAIETYLPGMPWEFGLNCA
jgi:hypothetical protein